MERPLHSSFPHQNDLHALAVALLHEDPTFEAHVALLGRLVPGPYAAKRLPALASRSVAWTAKRPQPRLKALLHLLRKDELFREVLARQSSPLPLLAPSPRMWPLEGASDLPRIETLRQLADWLRLDPEHLLWFADLQDRNSHAPHGTLAHYHLRLQPKPGSSSVRVIEAPKTRLKAIQRQILEEVLQSVPLHDAVHGFRKHRSIATFAAPHAGRAAVLRMDLKEFFPSISGPRVQAMFRTLGYPESVADLLGGLCTSTIPKGAWRSVASAVDAEELNHLRMLYERPHLPQGAPTSPALANLCAFRLDRRLVGLAHVAGAAYTRYADDLAFSGNKAFARSAQRFAAQAAAIAAEEGFTVQHRKTRFMRASVRQHVAGLTVNEHVTLARKDLEQLEAILTNCVRYGPETQNRRDHPDFQRYLQGRVAFVAMVVPGKAAPFQALLQQIVW